MSSERVMVRREPQNPSASLLHMLDGLKTAASLESTLQRITDSTASLLSIPRVSLWILDVSRTRTLVTARTGLSLHRRGGAELVVGEGPAGWVAAHGMLLRVDDLAMDPKICGYGGGIPPIGSSSACPSWTPRAPSACWRRRRPIRGRSRPPMNAGFVWSRAWLLQRLRRPVACGFR